jgi:5-(carboxyamino)imidazole ribonucleotide synthase
VTTLLGIVGGGQLGLMLAQAAAPLGVRCRFLDPDPNCCAARAGELIVGAYDDPQSLDRLAAGCVAVTYEFENVPAAAASHLERAHTLFPPSLALQTAQDRLHERTLFAELGIPSPSFVRIHSLEELKAEAARATLPALLKARRLGYDGKGQALLSAPADAEAAWDAIGRAPAILDAFVRFSRELSILAVRGRDGAAAFYPLVQNVHRGGILRLSRAPAPGVTPALQAQAERAARAILDRLSYVGVLAVEFFQVGDGPGAMLVANEIAPRVHNSGHWTIEGARTSQFENHIRAVLGMPLGGTAALGASAMVNGIGELPRADRVASVPGAVLHDYGKSPRPGRKVGHVTITAPDEAELDRRLEHYTRVVG